MSKWTRLEWIGVALLALLALGAAACSETDDPADGDALSDGDDDRDVEILPDGDRDTAEPDPEPEESPEEEAEEAAPEEEIEFGENEFPIRVPRMSLECESLAFPAEFYDTDHYCTFTLGGTDYELYVQATPVECNQVKGHHLLIGPYPTMQARAWIRTGGVMTEVSATYDWGSSHHNDEIGFTYGACAATISHSSIGSGFRSCAPPDCLRINPSDASCVMAQTETDGCDREILSGPPALNALCGQIGINGDLPILLDPWSEQEEDELYPLLPCQGDTGPMW